MGEMPELTRVTNGSGRCGVNPDCAIEIETAVKREPSMMQHGVFTFGVNRHVARRKIFYSYWLGLSPLRRAKYSALLS